MERMVKLLDLADEQLVWVASKQKVLTAGSITRDIHQLGEPESTYMGMQLVTKVTWEPSASQMVQKYVSSQAQELKLSSEWEYNALLCLQPIIPNVQALINEVAHETAPAPYLVKGENVEI